MSATATGPQTAAKGWTIEDVEARARAHPLTFRIPRETLRNSLKLGWYAKLIFLGMLGGERMWVVVTECLGRGHYAGRLESEPVGVPIAPGARVEFEARHVADVEPP